MFRNNPLMKIKEIIDIEIKAFLQGEEDAINPSLNKTETEICKYNIIQPKSNFIQSVVEEEIDPVLM